ncbi:hypothetical protein GYMLUDRAFT_556165 [Collybiopsis luxurians FD-317 M1]|uniref:Uncharacterized protein n=1 Tax=Collybiopsis luxurians FD-317 M1 TaxID=944289 RepID=A0A0D0BEV0_9AGAR|nr:hypothetical protein GYMLUDRAFT_556165 [Collybiopsis luxurians FD-317 M1]
MVANSSVYPSWLVPPIMFVQQTVQPLEAIQLLSFFLWGIYTVLFIVYVYFRVKQDQFNTRPRLYIVSLTALYLVIAVLTLLYTLSFNQAIISDTMIELTFDSSFSPSVGLDDIPDSHYFEFLSLNFGSTILYLIANCIADGVLICRCYYLWAARKVNCRSEEGKELRPTLPSD